jgi:hypothetical protein
MTFRVLANTNLGLSASSATVALPIVVVADRGGNGTPIKTGNKLILQADGADCYFKIGGPGVVATTGDRFLQDSAIEEFSIDPMRETHIAAIGSTGNLRISVGSDKR